jgi:hypothetical protein
LEGVATSYQHKRLGEGAYTTSDTAYQWEKSIRSGEAASSLLEHRTQSVESSSESKAGRYDIPQKAEEPCGEVDAWKGGTCFREDGA